MGTWGFNILDDDTTRDVYDDYMDRFNARLKPGAILKELKAEHDEVLGDGDEEPLFWIAVAKAQWDCGHLDAKVLKRVTTIIVKGKGLARWEVEGPKALRKRKTKLKAFLAAIKKQNPKPKKPKAPTQRKPPYEVGDCLAVRLSDGTYGAALVLGAEEYPNPNPREESYGGNLVGVLKYKSTEKPTREVFERREWLRLTHHRWGERHPEGCLEVLKALKNSLRPVAELFERVDRVPIRPDDPSQGKSLGNWGGIPEQVMLQDAWDRGIRD